MQAFHNSQEIKDKFLNRVLAHQEADEIIQRTYWEDGKGCAVGCTLELTPSDIDISIHQEYENQLGIPKLLARLEDGIFEGLPLDRSKKWPYEFLSSIRVGANLFDVWPKFATWLLTDKKYGVINFAKNKKSIDAIQRVSDCYSDFKNITINEWKEVYVAAAAAAAAYAAAYAADAAYAAAYAAAAAAYAAAAAAYAAAYAADAAYAAAYAAADASDAAAYAAAYAADAAYAAAKSKKHEVRIAQADKLLELLKQC